eukprot:995688-Pelagomonas_calceolata.AAC.1
MVPVGMHPAHCWVWTTDNTVNTVHIITKRASCLGGKPVGPDCMLLCVNCPCAITQGDLQPDCLADRPVTGPRQST